MDYNREDQFSVDRLINRTNAAEGTSLPPQQRGPFRVPYVSSVRVSSPSPTKYVVTWVEPENFVGKISQYNVFVNSSSNIPQPGAAISVFKSPATIRFLAPSGSRLTFFVQTQMGNGFVNPAFASPAATIVAP